MLPRSHRLPHEAFDRVFQKGKRITTPELQIIIVANDQPQSRFAVVVNLSVSKKAVDRNRTKRLIRESIHHQLSKITKNIDGIIIARKNLKDYKQKDVEKICCSIITRINPAGDSQG